VRYISSDAPTEEYTGDAPISILTKFGVGHHVTSQLIRCGINNLWQLTTCGDDVLLHINQISVVSLEKLDIALERIGWSRRPSHGIKFLRLPVAIHYHLLRGGWTTVAGLRYALQEGNDFQLNDEALTIIRQKLDAFKIEHSCSTHD